MILKIKGRSRLSLEIFKAVRRPSLINQERLVHGNYDGEEVALPWKEWVMVDILLLTHKHRFTLSDSSHCYSHRQNSALYPWLVSSVEMVSDAQYSFY